MTDYDRACGVEDYLGIIRVGAGTALVLGDEPMQTAWRPFTEDHGGTLIRWQWAPDEEVVLDHLARVPPQVWQPTGLTFDVLSEDLIIFDSACPGDDLDSSLEVRLGKGPYAIDTAHYQPDAETSLILHRLTPVNQSAR